MSSDQAERVSEAFVFACCGGHEGAMKALRARLEGESIRDAAAEGGVGKDRVCRVYDLYMAAVERLNQRVRDARAETRAASNG